MATAPARFRKTVIIGLGLVGGSLGLALRQHCKGVEVAGFDRAALGKAAVAAGAVDKMAARLEEALEGAGLVVLATPVGAILDLLPRLAPLLEPDSVVTDVGGTKREIGEAAQRTLGGRCSFIGGHPLAGAEQSGLQAARGDLFLGAPWVLCPSPTARPEAVGDLADLLTSIGALPVRLEPARHDRAVAAVSHLPQILAVALLRVVATHADVRLLETLAAGGFRDLTRIGSSAFSTWRDVLASNQVEMVAVLDRFVRELRWIRAGLVGGSAKLEGAFREAAETRRRVMETVQAHRDPRQGV
ncbi:MAG: prephenate dehydrogenase [Acidobacteriota bacterium]